MPLVWAHGEFMKLAVSRARREPCDRPPLTWARYGGARPAIDWRIWTPHCRPRRIAPGCNLRILLPVAALVHWSADEWRHSSDSLTRPAGLGMHTVELPCAGLAAGANVVMTFRWQERGEWEGRDYRIAIES